MIKINSSVENFTMPVNENMCFSWIIELGGGLGCESSHLSQIETSVTVTETNSSHLKIGKAPKGFRESIPLPSRNSGANS